MSPGFRAEASHHGFVGWCEACSHFRVAADDPDGTRAACDLLFPTSPHRRAAWQALADGDPLPFCKMFEADGAAETGTLPMPDAAPTKDI
jgi:hypothetical protein